MKEENMTVINGENLVLGRMASEIAKRLLRGESVKVINAEKVVIIGSREFIEKKFRQRLEQQRKGNPDFGPKNPKRPDAIVKRSVRGMLPWKRAGGKKALKQLMVFIGKPKELKEKEITPLDKAKNKEERNFVFLGDLSKQLGAKF